MATNQEKLADESKKWKKFKAPPNFVEIEEKLKDMIPTSKLSYEWMLHQLDDMARNSPNGAMNTQFNYLKASLEFDKEKEKFDDNFVLDFIKWILGRSEKNRIYESDFSIVKNANGTRIAQRIRNNDDPIITPWGNTPYTFLPDVKDFLSSIIDQRASAERYISKLKLRWPSNLTELWFWWKHIVHKQGLDGNIIDYARWLEPYEFIPQSKIPINANHDPNAPVTYPPAYNPNVDNPPLASYTYSDDNNDVEGFSKEVLSNNLFNPNPVLFNAQYHDDVMGRLREIMENYQQEVINNPNNGNGPAALELLREFKALISAGSLDVNSCFDSNTIYKLEGMFRDAIMLEPNDDEREQLLELFGFNFGDIGMFSSADRRRLRDDILQAFINANINPVVNVAAPNLQPILAAIQALPAPVVNVAAPDLQPILAAIQAIPAPVVQAAAVDFAPLVAAIQAMHANAPPQPPQPPPPQPPPPQPQNVNVNMPPNFLQMIQEIRDYVFNINGILGPVPIPPGMPPGGGGGGPAPPDDDDDDDDNPPPPGRGRGRGRGRGNANPPGAHRFNFRQNVGPPQRYVGYVFAGDQWPYMMDTTPGSNKIINYGHTLMSHANQLGITAIQQSEDIRNLHTALNELREGLKTYEINNKKGSIEVRPEIIRVNPPDPIGTHKDKYRNTEIYDSNGNYLGKGEEVWYAHYPTVWDKTGKSLGGLPNKQGFAAKIPKIDIKKEDESNIIIDNNPKPEIKHEKIDNLSNSMPPGLDHYYGGPDPAIQNQDMDIVGSNDQLGDFIKTAKDYLSQGDKTVIGLTQSMTDLLKMFVKKMEQSDSLLDSVNQGNLAIMTSLNTLNTSVNNIYSKMSTLASNDSVLSLGRIVGAGNLALQEKFDSMIGSVNSNTKSILMNYGIYANRQQQQNLAILLNRITDFQHKNNQLLLTGIGEVHGNLSSIRSNIERHFPQIAQGITLNNNTLQLEYESRKQLEQSQIRGKVVTDDITFNTYVNNTQYGNKGSKDGKNFDTGIKLNQTRVGPISSNLGFFKPPERKIKEIPLSQEQINKIGPVVENPGKQPSKNNGELNTAYRERVKIWKDKSNRYNVYLGKLETAKKENKKNNNNIIEYEDEEELMDISQTNFDEEFTEGEEFAPEVIGDSSYPEFNPTNQAVFMQEFGDFFNKHFKLLKQIIGPNKPDEIIQKEFASIMNFSVTDLLQRGMNAGEAVEVTARGFEVLMNQWQNSREIDIVKQYLNTVDKMIHTDMSEATEVLAIFTNDVGNTLPYMINDLNPRNPTYQSLAAIENEVISNQVRLQQIGDILNQANGVPQRIQDMINNQANQLINSDANNLKLEQLKQIGANLIRIKEVAQNQQEISNILYGALRRQHNNDDFHQDLQQLRADISNQKRSTEDLYKSLKTCYQTFETIGQIYNQNLGAEVAVGQTTDYAVIASQFMLDNSELFKLNPAEIEAIKSNMSEMSESYTVTENLISQGDKLAYEAHIAQSVANKKPFLSVEEFRKVMPSKIEKNAYRNMIKTRLESYLMFLKKK